MKIIDLGVILSVRKYSENSLILKIFSKNHGICSGFVKGALSSKKNRLLYQNGNLVEFVWSSKIEGNLGTLKIELERSFLANILSSKTKLSCFSSIFTIIETNISEGDSHEEIFDKLLNLLKSFNESDSFFLKEYVKLEIALLGNLGYGIDLSCCVATGVTNNLYFVSPKSARAVSKEAGWQYREKLLLLPKFLLEEKEEETNEEDLQNGLKLSGFFVKKYLRQ